VERFVRGLTNQQVDDKTLQQINYFCLCKYARKYIFKYMKATKSVKF